MGTTVLAAPLLGTADLVTVRVFVQEVAALPGNAFLIKPDALVDVLVLVREAA